MQDVEEGEWLEPEKLSGSPLDDQVREFDAVMGKLFLSAKKQSSPSDDGQKMSFETNTGSIAIRRTIRPEEGFVEYEVIDNRPVPLEGDAREIKDIRRRIRYIRIMKTPDDSNIPVRFSRNSWFGLNGQHPREPEVKYLSGIQRSITETFQKK